MFGGGLKDIVPILALAGAATIPIGYSIGTLALLVLKGVFARYFRNKLLRQQYEIYVSGEGFASILLRTKSPDNPWDHERPNLLYAAATFDHEVLPKGIHEWIRRHFNAFVVAFNSCFAIAISLGIVSIRSYFVGNFDPLCGLNKTEWQEQASWSLHNGKVWWLAVNGLLAACLFIAALISWCETMRMIEFQARRKNVQELS